MGRVVILERSCLHSLSFGHGSSPSYNDNYAIAYAIRNNNKTLVEMLLADSRVDPNARYGGALGVALSGNGVPLGMLDLLLEDPRVGEYAARNNPDNLIKAMASGSLAATRAIILYNIYM